MSAQLDKTTSCSWHVTSFMKPYRSWNDSTKTNFVRGGTFDKYRRMCVGKTYSKFASFGLKGYCGGKLESRVLIPWHAARPAWPWLPFTVSWWLCFFLLLQHSLGVIMNCNKNLSLSPTNGVQWHHHDGSCREGLSVEDFLIFLFAGASCKESKKEKREGKRSPLVPLCIKWP